MKKKCLGLLSVCLLLALLAGAMLPAWAAAKPSIQKESVWVGSPKRSPILLDWPDGAEILSITSANKSMMKTGKQKDFGPWGIWMMPLKIGKCRITIRYKLDGKTYFAFDEFLIYLPATNHTMKKYGITIVDSIK